jgi:hypothetical protein
LKSLLIYFLFLLPLSGYCQEKDTVTLPADIVTHRKSFHFLRNIPSDLGKTFTLPFAKKNLRTTAAIGTATALLIFTDQSVYETVRKFSDNIHLHPEESNKVLWSIKSGQKETVLLKVPKNLNTAFYTLGQGFTTLILAGGLAIDGMISRRKLSLQTAADLTEAFISLGIATQLLKYATGRENPAVYTRRNGKFQPFPSVKNFQNDKPKYDASLPGISPR